MAKAAKKSQVQVNTITEIELRRLITLREQAAAARRQAKTLEAEAKGMQEELLVRLDKGAVVDPESTVTAVATLEYGACRPEWKEEFLAHMEQHHGVSREITEENTRQAYPPAPVRVLNIGDREQ